MLPAGRNDGDAVGRRYLLYSLAGRPVVALPAVPSRLRHIALRRLQPSTTKRAAYRAVVGLSMLARVDWLFSRPLESPLDVTPDGAFEWDQWLAKMRGYFGAERLDAAVFWPTALNRGRLYAHLFDGEKPIGFAKVSLQSNGNARLRQEAETLRAVHAECPQTFRVPRLLNEGSVGPHAFLLLEPLPTSGRPISARANGYPAKCVQEYSGPVRHISASMIPALSWWGRYVERLGSECQQFHDEMISLLHAGIDVCRVHGDLSRHNILRDGRELWIYDWEESVHDAPARTDLVGFALGVRQAAVRANPALWSTLVRRQFLESGQVADRAEIMMALAFRHAAGIDDATLVIRNWGALNDTSKC